MNEHYRERWDSFYRRLAATYDVKVRLFSLLWGGQNRVFRSCLNQVTVESGAILDLGCGTGALADFLRNERPEIPVIGLDLSLEMLQIGRQRGGGGVNWNVQSDALMSPFRPNAFTTILIVAVLHELPYEIRRRVLAEVHRLLEPGGQLLVGEHFHEQHTRLGRAYQRLVFRLISAPQERATAADLETRGLDNELTAAGFAIVSKEVLPGRLVALTELRKVSIP